MCKNLLKPDIPKPPKPTLPPAPEQTKAVSEAGVTERQKLKRRTGRSATIATGATGLQSPANIGTRQLGS